VACRAALGGLPAAEAARALGAAEPGAVVAALRRERLGPLIASVVRGVASSEARALAARLETDYYAAARRYVLQAAAFRDVTRALGVAGLPHVVLKGMALAEPLYGNPALRPMDDVDVLVLRSDARRAREALEALGYRAAASFELDLGRRAASMFVGPAGLAIDLHWDLVDDKSGPAAGRWARGAWERAREGRLAPTDALVHACVHLTVNHGLLGALARCDIALMATRWAAAIDWDLLVAAAGDARLRGAVWAALRCTEATLGPGIPAGVLAALAPRGPRGRALGRWLLPRFARLGAMPGQDYVVPLLTMDRARDVAALLLRRLTT
jgi:hypothetical protein